jgi:hypothetical protein
MEDNLWTLPFFTIQPAPRFGVELPAYQAYRLKLTFNSGCFARVDDNKGRRYCQELHEQIQAGQFADDTIYVVHSQYWDPVSPHIPKIVCGRLSDHITCVSSLRNDAFRGFLEQHKLEYPHNGKRVECAQA